MKIGKNKYRFSMWRLLFTVATVALAVMGLRGKLPGDPLAWCLPAWTLYWVVMGDMFSTPWAFVGLLGFVRLPDEPEDEGGGASH